MIALLVSCLIIGEALAQNNFNPPIISRIAEDDVAFYLHNRDNFGSPTKLTISKNLHEVDTDTEVKILIHGFFENSNSDWYRNITREYLKKGNYSVIQVDWSKPASTIYTITSWNAQGVGVLIARMITGMYNNNMPLEKIHIIGHSLGAHVAGYAGKEVIKATGFPVFRITALDAAGPLFEGPFLMFEGLGKGDASIVDAIHTDGAMFGKNSVIADVDFYPNGGVGPQPGCDLFRLFLPPNNFVVFRAEVFCSHTKSYYYFTASINQETFIGVKCTSWKNYQQGNCNEEPTAVMGDGYLFSSTTTGSFFLKTNAHPPYAN